VGISNPDPRISSDWIDQPKNFTMFGIKYINEYDGTYFHFGESKVKGASNKVLEDSVYKEKYIPRDPTSTLTTTGRYQVSFSTHLYSKLMSGNAKMILNFKGNKCTISGTNGSQYQISGNGVFKKGDFEWGDKKRDGIVLKYSISGGKYTYMATDTLVRRDRGITLETYNPVKY
jgi:hypothetical protein